MFGGVVWKLAAVLPSRAAVSSFDLPKDIAVRVEETGLSEARAPRLPSRFG